MRALLSTFGITVAAQAETIPPTPDIVAMLRTCEPTDALVQLLANTATTWAKQGRLDDAAAALALGLCCRSAMSSRLTTRGENNDDPQD